MWDFFNSDPPNAFFVVLIGGILIIAFGFAFAMDKEINKDNKDNEKDDK